MASYNFSNRMRIRTASLSLNEFEIYLYVTSLNHHRTLRLVQN